MIHGIPEEEIIEKSQASVSLKVRIPSGSDYFDGHFPDLKLLPAVAQVDLLSHYAKKYFGIPIFVSAVKRFKFSGKILPDSTVIFKIDFDSESKKVSFSIFDSESKEAYSSGTYTAGEGE